MKRILISLFAISASLGASSVNAEVIATVGKITQIQLMGRHYTSYQTTGEAIAFIYVDTLPGACESTFNRVAITSNHPAFDIVVSGALAAKAASQTVRIRYVDDCTQWGNAWDFSILDILEN